MISKEGVRVTKERRFFELTSSISEESDGALRAVDGPTCYRVVDAFLLYSSREREKTKTQRSQRRREN